MWQGGCGSTVGQGTGSSRWTPPDPVGYQSENGRENGREHRFENSRETVLKTVLKI
jgi:hypothetical protein